MWQISHLHTRARLFTHAGYAQTFEEAYERIANLYKEEEAGEEHENPPVEDFLLWRDLRVFDGEAPSLFFLIGTGVQLLLVVSQSKTILNVHSLSRHFIFRDSLVLMVHRLLHGGRSHARYVQPRVDSVGTMANGDKTELFHEV